MIGKSVSHYRIIEKIGVGGMGEVYKAEDFKLGRFVAVKFLPLATARDANALERFQREARAASALNHPNICTIHAIDEDDGRFFIVMELLEGETLRQRIGGQPMSLDDLLEIAVQIADALDAADAKKIVHRDIKPTNIFISQGRPKILDFGLAKPAGLQLGLGETISASSAPTASIEGGNLTSAGTALGTVAYMSPEQARGEDVDERSDLFSFGGVLYEMATGRAPFSGNTPAVIFEAILNRAPVPPTQLNPRLPPELDRIIMHALEKDPRSRYSKASEIRSDLQHLKRESGSGRNAAVPVARTDKSLAVLYFENMSGSKDDEYFRDGMSEDIITELLKIKGLHVFPRNTVVPFRDTTLTAPEIGQRLGADFVLAGSVRRAGNRLRINAQLVDTSRDYPVWAERFDRELKDVFEVQEEIARSIAQTLRIKLSPQEEQIVARKPTGNPEAYDYLLRGRKYARMANLEFAMQMYQHAVRLDPEFAEAYAGIAQVCGAMADYQGGDPLWLERGLRAVEQALSLRPDIPEALSARARLYLSQKDYSEAAQWARRAIELKPDCEEGYVVLGKALFESDRWQEAAELVDRALEASGDDYNIFPPFRNVLRAMGDKARALKLEQRYMEALERRLEMVPEDVRAQSLLATSYSRAGKMHEAMVAAEKAVALRPRDSRTLYNAACTYGVLCMKSEALAMFRRAIEAGYRNSDYAARDDDLACLRDDLEFMRLVASGWRKV